MVERKPTTESSGSPSPEIFIDHCNECQAEIEIDMETFLYTAHCSCNSDIKKSIGETREMTRRIKQESLERTERLMKQAGLNKPFPKLFGFL